MERIVLEVGNDTARKWQYATSETKERIYLEIDRFLKIALNKPQNELWPFLEKLRLNAEKKGFNDEILNEILNEE